MSNDIIVTHNNHLEWEGNFLSLNATYRIMFWVKGVDLFYIYPNSKHVFDEKNKFSNTCSILHFT